MSKASREQKAKLPFNNTGSRQPGNGRFVENNAASAFEPGRREKELRAWWQTSVAALRAFSAPITPGCGNIDCRLQFPVLFECVQIMSRVAVEDNNRLSVRIRAEEKALLLRAVALNHTDLTGFVLHHALLAAKAVIEEAEHVRLSGRDSVRVLDLLENPPAPNAKLRAAARALPKRV